MRESVDRTASQIQPSVATVASTCAEAEHGKLRRVPIRSSSGTSTTASILALSSQWPSVRNSALSTKDRTGADGQVVHVGATQSKVASDSAACDRVQMVVAAAGETRTSANGAEPRVRARRPDDRTGNSAARGHPHLADQA